LTARACEQEELYEGVRRCLGDVQRVGGEVGAVGHRARSLPPSWGSTSRPGPCGRLRARDAAARQRPVQ